MRTSQKNRSMKVWTEQKGPVLNFFGKSGRPREDSTGMDT